MTTYTVITYDADGNEMSVYTTPPGFGPDDPQQITQNALDLSGTVRAVAWEGQYRTTPTDAEPVLTVER